MAKLRIIHKEIILNYPAVPKVRVFKKWKKKAAESDKEKR